MRAPELDIRVSLATIAEFTDDGEVYRAYVHALAACRGMVLLVPLELVNGDLTELVDGCPIPWEEVIAILESPQHSPAPLADHIQTVLGRPLGYIAPTHWDVDSLPVGNLDSGSTVTRLSHPSGIRLAVLTALVPQGWR